MNSHVWGLICVSETQVLIPLGLPPSLSWMPTGSYSPFNLAFMNLIFFAKPMASRWRLRLRMTEPHVSAPARAPAKPHTNTSWPATQKHNTCTGVPSGIVGDLRGDITLHRWSHPSGRGSSAESEVSRWRAGQGWIGRCRDPLRRFHLWGLRYSVCSWWGCRHQWTQSTHTKNRHKNMYGFIIKPSFMKTSHNWPHFFSGWNMNDKKLNGLPVSLIFKQSFFLDKISNNNEF